MALFSTLMVQAAAFALVMSRLSGFVVVSPFPGNNVPAMQRVGLVVVLAWVTSLFAPTAAVPADLGMHLIMSAMLELGCGLAIGFAFRLVFSASEVLGAVLSQATGLSAATVLNPASDSHDSALGRIVSLLAMLVALGAGVHRIALAYLLQSFRAIPVGTAMSIPQATGAFVDLAGSAVEVGVELAMPVVAVGLVIQIGLALIARAAPSLQIFSVGLGILIASGFVTIIATLGDMGSGLTSYFGGLAGHIDEVLFAIAGGAK
jgi:flagellar biosynthetic protein FliR